MPFWLFRYIMACRKYSCLNTGPYVGLLKLMYAYPMPNW